MSRPIRVLIVDDHVIVREGLRTLLGEEPTVEVVGEAANAADALTQAACLQPDVILMDLMMPGLDSLAATRQLRGSGAAAQVLILTSFLDDDRVRAVIEAGAIGYLLKDVDQSELVGALHAAAQGRPTLHPEVQRRIMRQVAAPPAPASPLDALTPRERDVLRLIAQGGSNKEIAAALDLTEGTVKGYVGAILAKLAVADRTQAALLAVKHGLVTLD